MELLHIPFHLGFFTKAGVTRIKSGKVSYEERARLAVPEGEQRAENKGAPLLGVAPKRLPHHHR